MLWKIISTIVATQVLLIMLLVGCQPSQPKPGPNMVNPASDYCVNLGFKEQNRQGEAGEYGVCVFPGGSECNSWDFLAGRCGQEHSYCEQQGYTIQPTNGNIAVCVFDDGSTCDEYSYFKGTCKPGSNQP